MSTAASRRSRSIATCAVSRVRRRSAGGCSGGSPSPSSIAGAPILGDDAEGVIDGEPEVRFHLRCPRRVRARWRATVELARRVAGEQMPVWRAAEAIAAEGLSSPEAASGTGVADADGCSAGSNAAARSPAAGLDADGGPWATPPHEAGEAAVDRDETSPTEVELDWSAVAAAIPEDIAILGRDLDRLDAFELDARLRAVMHARSRIDWQTGRLLRLFLDLRLDRAMGFSSSSRYLRERMGMSVRKGRALVAIERKTWEAPAFGEAYREGRLSWVRALMLLPVVREGAPDAWVERAAAVTVRRLAGEVEWALDVRDTGPSCEPLTPPPPDADLAACAVQTRAPAGWDFLDAAVEFRGPASVVALLRSAIAAFEEPVRPPWRALERLLEHAQGEWERLPHHRDPVFARDGWRCAVPACSSRRNLHDHHIHFRSRGGDNARENRVAVCAWHHLRGIHAGRVRACGAAPGGVQWEIGTRSGGPPLMRLLGDRYVRECSP